MENEVSHDGKIQEKITQTTTATESVIKTGESQTEVIRTYERVESVESRQLSSGSSAKIQQKNTEALKRDEQFEEDMRRAVELSMQEEAIKTQSETVTQRIKTKKTSASKNFAQYQNQPVSQKPTKSQATVKQPQQKPAKVQQKSQQLKKQQSPSNEEKSPVNEKKKKHKKKPKDEGEPLPVISADSEAGKKEILSEKKIQEPKIVKSSENSQAPSGVGDDKPSVEQSIPKVQQLLPNNQRPESMQVSEIIEPAVSAGLIIFEAQRQRIGSTLDLFNRYISKHEKHTTNQKQLVSNVEEQIEKKRVSKQPLCNALQIYCDTVASFHKELYEKSYKFTKSDKILSANPMINIREELKGGIDEMIFLRKSVGNEFNRLGDFIQTNTGKNIVKLFTDYWKTVSTAQAKHKQKKEEFYRKQKQFNKRINKVIKVYTKGRQGSSQEQDLFIEMTKFITQEKQFRNCLIDYGTSLLPLKKSFVKAEQVLYQELQTILNQYKNQFRSLYLIHPKEFSQLEKLDENIRQNNTFEKLCDITDGDYVRSVLLSLEKASIQELTDREFEKVLNLHHFEEVAGNPLELLKGTTTKSFELKNKFEQVVDTVSGNLLIFNKQSAQMKEKFIIKNINARIVQDGVVEIDQVLKGIIFDSNRTLRLTFRDNDRAEELICFLNQVHENIKENQASLNSKK